MRELYNIGTVRAVSTETLSKCAVCMALIVLCAAAISCRKAATATVYSVGTRPTKEAITEADGLYAQRTDVVKVRQAIVALRQAQADDSTNYDLAWRLAKYNYYLGSHTTESTEKGKAFHDGVEAAKLAVQLKPDKPDG